MHYTSLTNTYYWSVNFQGAKVGNYKVGGDTVMFAILDTGTTLISMTKGDFVRLVSVYSQHYTADFRGFGKPDV